MVTEEKRPSTKVIVTVPYGIHAKLEEVATREGRAVGNLAGSILEAWVRAEQEKETYCPRDIVNLLSETIINLANSRTELGPDTESKMARPDLLKLLREVDNRFTQAFCDPTHRDVVFETAKPYSVAGGLQLNEFIAILVEAGDYATAVIPQIFERLGPLPMDDAFVDPLVGMVKPYERYLSRLDQLEGVPGFTQKWILECKKAVLKSIKYIPESEWKRYHP